MRVGILADAHGNLAGLDACLNFLRGRNIAHCLYLGDAVGYFAQSEAVCARLRALSPTIVQGNHEAMLAGQLPVTPEARDIIRLPSRPGPQTLLWLRECAAVGPCREVCLGGRRIHMAHGSPQNPLLGRIESSDQVTATGYDVIVLGHTHRPFVGCSPSGALALNPGSCGYPRDNGRCLSLAVLDTVSMAAEIFRIPFVWPQDLLEQAHSAVRRALNRMAPPLGTMVALP
ncbi:metallophosphoesterase family protein [uncultured Desulfovibrio sp.]|uniref:metallophosphoesterase family protein n=1 Tax=uncultured Desulfovibrio sp. TaxID=167968 RepID=UPI002631F3F6|nr:metallophosphoesterase family protein [uncultured Desulfovibrio sp.]